jgi:hypothetical protein
MKTGNIQYDLEIIEDAKKMKDLFIAKIEK